MPTDDLKLYGLLIRARDILLNCEWADDGYCPACYGHRSFGHSPFCDYVLLMKEIEEESNADA